MARKTEATVSDQTLPENQVRAAILLAGGMGETAVADVVGVARQTIWEWKRRVEFRAALNRERAAAREAWQDEAQGMNRQALDVIRAALASDEPSMAFRAACFVLSRSGMLSGQAPEIGPQSASMVALSSWTM